MPRLTWDADGQRAYQLGVSNGVLYLKDGRVAVWNGLTAVEESSDSERTSYYLDGVKFLENLAPGEFSAKLKAWTYPDEFDEVTGIAEAASGLYYHEQPPSSFNLSYQTRIGNDSNSNAGYKIHLLYNLLASPDEVSFVTVSDEVAPVEFSWSLTGTPPRISGFRPTAHVTVDTTKTDPAVVEVIENILYGTETTQPRFLSIGELRSLFETVGVLAIIDNGDGTWTAIDVSDQYITMDTPTQFTIAGADAEFVDATTYTISTTNP